jgi:hypothetical protein
MSDLEKARGLLIEAEALWSAGNLSGAKFNIELARGWSECAKVASEKAAWSAFIDMVRYKKFS